MAIDLFSKEAIVGQKNYWRYEKAKAAIVALYNDYSVPENVTRRNIQNLRNYTQVLLDLFPQEAAKGGENQWI